MTLDEIMTDLEALIKDLDDLRNPSLGTEPGHICQNSVHRDARQLRNKCILMQQQWELRGTID